MKNNEFNKIKDEIYQWKLVETGINSFKTKYHLDTISKYFNQVFNLVRLKRYSINNLKKEQILDIEKDEKNLLKSSGMWKELGWTALILNKYSFQLKEFIKERSKFESFFIIGDYKNAELLLDQIENNYGYSRWSVINRINLLQDTKGLDAQKDFCDKLSEEGHSVSFEVILFFASLAAERNTSHDYFNKKLNSFFRLTKDTEWYDYYRFLLQRDHLLNQKNIVYVLRRSSSESFIDIYDVFLRILTLVCLNDLKKDNETETFKKILRKLHNNLENNELINFIRKLGTPIKITNEEKNLELLNLYDNSFLMKYEGMKEVCERYITKEPTNINIYSVYAAVLNGLGEESSFTDKNIQTDIINIMISLEKNENFDSSIKKLLHIIVTYPSLVFIDKLIAYFFSKMDDYSLFIINSSGILETSTSQIKCLNWDRDIKKYYIDELLEINKKSLLTNLVWKTKYSTQEDFFQYIDAFNFPEEIYKMILAQYYDIQNKHKESAEHALFLVNNTKNELQFFAKDLYLDNLIKIDIYAAADILINYYIKDKYSDLTLPIIKLCNLIEEDIDKKLQWPSSINVVILFHLYFKYRNLKKKSRLEYLYEVYLEANNFTKPMELINDYKDKYKNFDPKTIYYLKEICIPDIMKKSIYFNDPELKERERINICHELTNIDSNNKKQYFDEIKEREQELFLKNEMNRIGKNKIYVNIDGVKKILDETIKEDFIRFKDLLITRNIDLQDIFNVENKIINNAATIEYKSIENIDDEYNLLSNHIPNDEIYDLMRNIFNTIIDTFVNHEHYGLNVYLSTRIRHGTIKNHLRKPAEDENLISLHNRSTKKYNTNQYWKNIFSLDEAKEQAKLQKLLENFSFVYDNLIDHINKNVLQIMITTINLQENQVSVNKDAMFNYSFSEYEILSNLKEIVSTDIEYEEFVESILSILWERTDENLFDIRNFFDYEMKIAFTGNITKLKNEVNKLDLDKKHLDEFRTSVTKVQSELSKSINSVTQWFYRLHVYNRNDYNITNVIDLVTKTIPKAQDKIIIDVKEDLILKGKTLESFVDIFYILIDNSIKYNELKNVPSINIIMHSIENEITIYIENIINDKYLSIDELNKSIIPIKESYGERISQKRVYSEGKTGFIKIHKILTVDLNINQFNVDFGYKENKSDKVCFYVNIRFNSKGVLA